ncbi:MAG: substrate-binding domain-containing protein, partial [Acidimicrobiia bacterium]|nr:substrate-binding domain-containing protein [Acidimicrobiia bacterium]
MRTSLVLLTALTLSLAGACAGDDEDAGGDITVFAAASLTSAYEELGALYEEQHDGASVELNFAASSELEVQIAEGAGVDVFASADQVNMDKVASEVDGEPSIFATNRLTILTEPGNPKGIEDVAGLADPELIIVSCG